MYICIYVYMLYNMYIHTNFYLCKTDCSFDSLLRILLYSINFVTTACKRWSGGSRLGSQMVLATIISWYTHVIISTGFSFLGYLWYNMHIYIFISIHMYMHIYIYIRIYIYVYVYTYIYIYVCVYIYVYVSIRIYVYLCIYLSIYPSIHLTIYLFMYLHAQTYVRIVYGQYTG